MLTTCPSQSASSTGADPGSTVEPTGTTGQLRKMLVWTFVRTSGDASSFASESMRMAGSAGL